MFACTQLAWPLIEFICWYNASRKWGNRMKWIHSFLIPSRSLSYAKIMQGERRTKWIHSFLIPSRSLSYAKIMQIIYKQKDFVELFVFFKLICHENSLTLALSWFTISFGSHSFQDLYLFYKADQQTLNPKRSIAFQQAKNNVLTSINRLLVSEE